MEKAFSLNSHHNICDAAILFCVIFYVTSKILIYLFLVEKAYIVRGSTKRRFRDKLYIFNTILVTGTLSTARFSPFSFRIILLTAN